MPAYLTLAQAAAQLGMSASTLARQARDGRLKAIRPGHDWLVTPAEVARYDRENRRRPAEVIAEGATTGSDRPGATPKERPTRKSDRAQMSDRNERPGSDHSEMSDRPERATGPIERAIASIEGRGEAERDQAEIERRVIAGLTAAPESDRFGSPRPAPKPGKSGRK